MALEQNPDSFQISSSEILADPLTGTHLPALLYLWVDKRLNPKFPMVTHAIRMLTVEGASSRVGSSNFLLLVNQDLREDHVGSTS